MGKSKIKKMRKKYEVLYSQVRIMELQQRLEELKRSSLPKLGFHHNGSH